MAAPIVMSDQDLFALTGDWNAAAALRDQQNRALNEYNWSQSAPSNVLSGNIMAGASWNSTNTALQDALTQATGQQTSNYAVGGSTTTDTLNQLNTFLAGGGSFDPNATVYLQAGGVDFIQGVDKGVVKDNLNQIVKTLGDQGVNVVLTGSPYAASVQDVIDNKFNPEVDQIFKDVAKANSNVALVNTQGEILQNKNLLVDALHTNAEGTAIYNQSVIDALSQFKNEVPSSTPQAIAQVQKTSAIPTARGTVIEGDNIDEQIAALPELMYQTRTNPNNPAVWETYNPKTGEIVDTGTFAGGGDQGLLRAAAPVIGLAASTVGLPFITQALTSAFPSLTGSALAGATGATIGAGTQAVTGGSAEDIARAALLGGGGAYLGSQLNDYIASMDVPVDFTNMTPEQIADATETNLINDMKRAGLTNAQIDDFISNAGGTLAATPVAVSTPVADAGSVNVTAPTSLNNVISTLGSTVPTLTVATPKATQMTTQEAVDLVNSQLASNVKTPTNLANLEVTGNRPATVQEVVSAITSTLPTITSTQAQNIAEQVVTSNRPVTTQEVINAITASLPSVTTTTPDTTTQPELTVTAQRPIGETLATLPATLLPDTVTTPTKTDTVTTKTKETDPIKVAQLALSAAGLLGAGAALSNTGTPTGFDIVPIPTDWKTPPKTGVAPFTPLTPINFGDRNLLIGTQWEKFLDPNYGKVPAPVQYTQPTNLSYNDLMGILGSKQGMPPASSLSINDIISGIQNQYGQASNSAMG